jgi:hypothetical protein
MGPKMSAEQPQRNRDPGNCKYLSLCRAGSSLFRQVQTGRAFGHRKGRRSVVAGVGGGELPDAAFIPDSCNLQRSKNVGPRKSPPDGASRLCNSSGSKIDRVQEAPERDRIRVSGSR